MSTVILVFSLFTVTNSALLKSSSSGNNITPSVTTTQSSRKQIHIAGLFPMTGDGGWIGGQGCQPAAMMGFDDVNYKSNVLPGYELVLHWNDSQVFVITNFYNIF